MSWGIVKIGDVCEIIAGQSPPSSTYNNDGKGYPFFQGKADFGKVNPIVRTWCSAPKKIALPNDILLSVRAPVGSTNLCDTHAAIGRGLSAIRAGKSFDPIFVLYYFRSYAHIIEGKGVGSTFSAITQKDIKNIPIPLPPLKIQKRIAELLDKAQALIDKRKEQIALMDQLIQSLFYDMFGDPVKNPKGWDVKPLCEIVIQKTQNGLYVPKESYSEEGIEMVHMSDAFYGAVSIGSMKRVKISENKIQKYKLYSTDLILARRSLNYEGAAKPCKIPVNTEPIVYESSLIRVSPDTAKILTIYLYFYLNDERVRKTFIYKYITKSTISGINNKALNKIQIVLPPINLQNTFAKRVKKIEAQKEAMTTSLKELENNFNSLMQRAFKGEM